MWWQLFEVWITNGLTVKENRCHHASHILEMLLNSGINLSNIRHHFEMYIEYRIKNCQSNLMVWPEHSVSGEKSVNLAEAKCVGWYLIAMPRTAKFIDKLSVLTPKTKKKSGGQWSK